MPTIILPSVGTASITPPASGVVLFSNSDNNDELSTMDTNGTITSTVGGGGILVYTALLEGFGSSAPTVTVLEDSIGITGVNRLDTGAYQITSNGKFTANKVFCIVNLSSGSPSLPYTPIHLSGVYYGDVNSIIFETSESGALRNDLVAGFKHSIEIRVYPGM